MCWYLYVCVVDGQWGPWKNGLCNVTCGGGILTRTRKCDDPSPCHGGKDCVGDNTSQITCNDNCCQGIKLHVYVASYIRM